MEQTYIRRFLIGAVARALRPGCKMDTALVLTGKQGAKKSTFFKTLFGEWFGDSPIPIGNKDAFIQMAASWGYEAQELESTRKKEVEAVRGFMSSGCDTYRAPYASTAKPHRRHSVLCGSTNDDVFLTDDAGSRRFWPIAVADHLDIVWLAENRDQIWAEAVAFYEGGEQWHLTPEEEDGRVEDAVRFTEGDVWAEPIARALATATGWVTINDVLDELKIELGRRGMVEARRAGKVLKALGWERADVPVADQKAHGLPKHAYRRVVK